MRLSYHNHTNMSDGDVSLEEMIEAARQAGIDEFGISDHYCLYPGGRPIEWSMPVVLLDEYVERIRMVAAETQSPIIRLGLEADYFPETIEQIQEIVAVHPFDYLIGSVHFVDDFPIDTDAGDWEAISPPERDEVWRLYWIRLKQMAESRAFDIVAHPDLPKKFGYLPSIDLEEEEQAALDAIAASGMSIEINTAGWYKPAAEMYPSLRLLREASRRNIPLQVNVDSHHPNTISRDYDRAASLAREIGYTKVVGYERRQRLTVPL